MFNREKNGAEKEKKNRKMTIKIKKACTRAQQSEKNGNRNTHVYMSWSFVRKLCLQVDLRFAFTLFYR